MATLAVIEFRARDEDGNFLTDVDVEVRRETGGLPLVQIYADRDGATPLGNPVNFADGIIRFYVAEGSYQVEVSKDGIGVDTYHHKAAGTMSERDDPIPASDVTYNDGMSPAVNATVQAALDALFGAGGGVDTPFETNNETTPTPALTSRSVRGRFSDTVWAMDFGLDPTGASANLHTVIENAVAEAQARGRSEIRLPAGSPQLGGTASIINQAFINQDIRIIGCGAATKISKSAGTGNWFDIGTRGLSPDFYTGNVIFEEMAFVPSVNMTAGTIFSLKLCSSNQFRRLDFRSVRRAFELGVGASVTNDCVYTDLQDCQISPNAAGVSLIEIASGGVLNIKGSGRHNGNGTAGSYFIQHSDTTFSWDGLYVYDQFFEQFPRYMNSVGGGVTNLIWTGGQVDRGDIFFNVQAPPGGINKNWSIHDLELLADPSSTNSFPLFWDAGSDGNHIKFNNNRCHHMARYVWIVTPGKASIIGNAFNSCGRHDGSSPPAGTACVRVGGQGMVAGNVSYVESGFTANQWGIIWDGASDTANRGSGENKWIGRTSADETGTV